MLIQSENLNIGTPTCIKGGRRGTVTEVTPYTFSAEDGLVKVFNWC
jgi:hypothetical protein